MTARYEPPPHPQQIDRQEDPMHGDQRRLAHAPAGDNPRRRRHGEEHETDPDDGPADIERDQQGAGNAGCGTEPLKRGYYSPAVRYQSGSMRMWLMA